MKERYEVRLAGSGGQGLVLGGVILAEAAIFDGKNAAQTQSYGPESRGGASKSEVIISDTEIDYPKATVIDLMLLFTAAAAEKYLPDAPKDCLIVADEDLVSVPVPKGVIQVPITRIAREKVGREFVANIVALGLLNELAGIVTPKSLEKAVLGRVPKGTEELNKKALKLGIGAAKAHKSS